jgi:hypothetical protein
MLWGCAAQDVFKMCLKMCLKMCAIETSQTCEQRPPKRPKKWKLTIVVQSSLK